MKIKKSSLFVKLIACILVAALVTPCSVSAAVADTVQPLASDYLASYTSYICPMGDGKLEIWYRVTGTATWAELGVLTIRLYKSVDNSSWIWEETFRYTDYPQMLAQNAWQNMSHVDYQGAAGYYYKAIVTIWGGDGETGDTRYIWTPVELAT